ncbi:hypothetical protein GBA52_009700 [Prunus armeniaca]|nr:hypothetical protein GBA52_009700 [Prunus armeniaca]
MDLATINILMKIYIMLVLLHRHRHHHHHQDPTFCNHFHRAEFSPPPPPPPRSPNPYLNPNRPPPSGTSSRLNTRICYESCSYECRGEVRKNNSSNPSPIPPDFPDQPIIRPMGCGGYCYLRCSQQMPPNLYQCTAGCAYNFITTTTPTQSNEDSGT